MSELGFYVTKHLGITYVGILYFLVATVLSAILERFLVSFKKLKEIPTLFVIFSIACVTIVAYYSRLIVKNVPFFMDGFYGYRHNRLKEINGGVIIAFSIFALQPGLADGIRKIPWIQLIRGK